MVGFGWMTRGACNLGVLAVGGLAMLATAGALAQPTYVITYGGTTIINNGVLGGGFVPPIAIDEGETIRPTISVSDIPDNCGATFEIRRLEADDSLDFDMLIDGTDRTSATSGAVNPGQFSQGFDLEGFADMVIDPDERAGLQVTGTYDSGSGCPGDPFEVFTDGSFPNIFTIVNTDAPGVTVTAGGQPISINEIPAGNTDTFDVVLDFPPSGNVVLDISSDDPGEATVSPAQLTFTTGTWDSAQTVTVTGQEDLARDGDQAVAVTVSINQAGTSADYDGIGSQTVDYTVVDNGAVNAGINVTPDPLSVTEGATGNFSVTLNSQPVSDVVIDVASLTPAQATVAAGQRLTFTNGDWNTPQTVQITAVDDGLVDGDVDVDVSFTVDDAASDDDYDGETAQATVTTLDIEPAGIQVTGTGSTLTESGSTVTRSIRLTSQPPSDVVINVTSTDESEATVSPATLTFSDVTWDQPQTITVTGENDFFYDEISNTSDINLNVAAGSANAYLGESASFTVTTTDDDALGVGASIAPSTVDEGGTATFSIWLTAIPETFPPGGVTINTPSSDASALKFTSDAGNNNIAFAFVSGDYAVGVDPSTVVKSQELTAPEDANQINEMVDFRGEAGALFNQVIATANVDDNDDPSFTVAPATATVSEGATNANAFTVVLDVMPASDVVFSITSADTGEAEVDTSPLTFTSANWDTPQPVSISGVTDNSLDGDQVVDVTVAVVDASSDDGFDPLLDQTVAVTVEDVQTPSITITPSGGTTDIAEAGETSDTFDVSITAPFEGDPVTITLTSDGLNAPADFTLSETSFQLTSASPSQTITVTAIDDALVEGSEMIEINASFSQPNNGPYSNGGSDQVDVTVTDNDSLGFEIEQTNVATNEGGTTSFTARLTGVPATGDVTLAFNPATPPGSPTDYSVSPDPTGVTLNAGQTEQVFTITPVDDDIVEGTENFTIGLDATFPDAGPTVINDTVDLALSDNGETVGIAINAIDTDAAEEGQDPASFDVALTSEPSGNVTVSFSIDSPPDATPDSASFVFTSVNWDSPQTVTLTPVDDMAQEGEETITFTAAVTASAADEYPVATNATETFSIADNDVPGLIVSAASGAVGEDGTTATFTVRLASQPSDTVNLDVIPVDATELSVTGGVPLSFSTGNWNTPQTITVTGVDDDIVDGDVTSAVNVSVAPGSPDSYDGVTGQVSISNTDNDSAGLNVVLSGAEVTEDGTTVTATLTLDAEPTGQVVVDIASADTGEVTVSPAQVTFNTGESSWQDGIDVTLTGVDDPEGAIFVDGDQPVAINAAVVDDSSDDEFDTLTASEPVTNADTDVGSYIASLSSPLNEGDATGLPLQIAVTSPMAPGTSVTFSVVAAGGGGTPAGGEVTLSPSPLTLTATAGDSTPSGSIQVVAIDDGLVEPDEDMTFTITASLDNPDVVNDDAFDQAPPSDLMTTIIDNDVAGVSITPSLVQVQEDGGTGTFEVTLDSVPSQPVEVAFASTAAGVVAVTNNATVTFPADAALSDSFTVTLTGTSDINGNQDVPITATVTSTDPNYPNGALPAGTITARVIDLDVPGLLVDPGSVTVAEGSLMTFDVSLTTVPGAPVDISLTGGDATEATLSPVTFMLSDMTPQTVTVTGLQDGVLDGTQTFQVTATVTSGNYAASDQPVTISVTDSGFMPSIVLAGPGGSLFEADPTIQQTITVTLSDDPGGDVYIDFGASDPARMTHSPGPLVLNSGNWNTGVPVTMAGQSDGIDNLFDTVQMTFTVDPGQTTSDTFDGMAPAFANVTVVDDGLTAQSGPAPSAPIVDILPTAVTSQVNAIFSHAAQALGGGGGQTVLSWFEAVEQAETRLAQRQIDAERLAYDAYNRTADRSIQIGEPRDDAINDPGEALLAFSGGRFPIYDETDGMTGLWGEVIYDDLDRSTPGFEFDGHVISALTGLTVRAGDDVVVGIAAGFEGADLDTTYNGGTLESAGLILAPYIAARLDDTLVLQATAGVGLLNYDSVTGAGVTADFDSTRWFGAVELGGSYEADGVVLSPSLSVIYAVERVEAYTDSGGTAFGEAEYSFGRFSGGLEVSVPLTAGDAMNPSHIEPYGFARGEYDFTRDADNAFIPAGAIDDDEAGLVIGGGLRWRSEGGTRIEVEGRINAIGRDDLDSYTLRGAVVIPLD